MPTWCDSLDAQAGDDAAMRGGEAVPTRQHVLSAGVGGALSRPPRRQGCVPLGCGPVVGGPVLLRLRDLGRRIGPGPHPCATPPSPAAVTTTIRPRATPCWHAAGRVLQVAGRLPELLLAPTPSRGLPSNSGTGGGAVAAARGAARGRVPAPPAASSSSSAHACGTRRVRVASAAIGARPPLWMSYCSGRVLRVRRSTRNVENLHGRTGGGAKGCSVGVQQGVALRCIRWRTTPRGWHPAVPRGERDWVRAPSA